MSGKAGAADGRGRILVADDLEFARGILKMLLRREYDVVEAADGRAAIEVLKTQADSLCCVLLDIKMPGVDGYGVLDFMRGAGLLDRIPVIALTSISDPEGHIRCYESGAIDLIEKPYDEGLLMYKIHWDIERFRRLADRRPPSPLRAVEEHCRKAFGLESADEVRGMAESFLRSFGECAKKLQSQVKSPDFAAVRDVSHDLRGFASNSGANDLADLTAVLSACAKAGDADATAAAVRLVLSLYDAYRA